MDSRIVSLIVAWAFVILVVSGVIFFQRKHHPLALFYLFFTELWERFSYYGMRALLILYMTTELAYADPEAYGIYGAYVSLVYATPILGGMIADRYLGSRTTILLGGTLMALGHFAMAFEYKAIFFLALGFLIIGNGFFKPNISTLVGKLYLKDDPRKDSAFTLFYMGINAGALMAPITCGTVGIFYGRHWGFTVAGIGMLIGLIIFLLGQRNKAYEYKGLPPDPELIKKSLFAGLNLKTLIIAAAFISVPLFSVLVNFNTVAKWILYLVIAGMIVYLFVIASEEEKEQKERLWVVMVLFFFSTMFWTFFELAGSVITLFTDRNVNRNLAGEVIPTESFQGVNPFFILIFAPIFAWLWEKLRRIQNDPSIPVKFAFALVQLGFGFGILFLGAKIAGPDGLAPLSFLVLAYLLHTTGELCLSPIGLSLVTKLSPAKIVAFVMGFWLLSSSLAGIIGSEIGKIARIPESEPGAGVSPLETLPVYSNVFEWIMYVSIMGAVVLFALSPVLKKWMHGVK